jgi:hypothetical protein
LWEGVARVLDTLDTIAVRGSHGHGHGWFGLPRTIDFNELRCCLSIDERAGEGVVGHAGTLLQHTESVNSLANSSTDRQLVNSLANSSTDRQLVNSLANSSTDRQLVNSLANSSTDNN